MKKQAVWAMIALGAALWLLNREKQRNFRLNRIRMALQTALEEPENMGTCVEYALIQFDKLKAGR